MASKTQFNMRLSSDLRARLDAAAQADHRSTSSLVAVILDSWFNGREYRPGFDPATLEVAPREDRLRRAPGRPRTRRQPRAYTGNLKPAVVPFLADRARATLDDIIAATGIAEQAGTRLVLRELLIELGWNEYQDEDENRVWAKDLQALAEGKWHSPTPEIAH